MGRTVVVSVAVGMSRKSKTATKQNTLYYLSTFVTENLGKKLGLAVRRLTRS